ncbi:MAG: hypothetical protein HGA75_05730 [Thiobacillus sp.]|nr:hypothetical protein [Thiobacillus sp.]
MRVLEDWRERLLRLDEHWHRSFSWKVRWRMAHDRNPLLTTVQDKYLVKMYARERGVQAVANLHVTEDPEDIPFDALPAEYFIKASHGCGWNIAAIDGALYRFKDGGGFVGTDGRRLGREAIEFYRLSREAAVALCRDWLGRKYRRQEWAYQAMRPRILVEPAVAQRGGGIFKVYRLYTMAGHVRAIAPGGPLFALTDSDTRYFDRDWRVFRMTREKVTVADASLWRRPEPLAEMVAAAESLGRGLDFVRVDLYDTPEGIRLGEMTVYPYGGFPGKLSSCRAFNHWLGSQWTLPSPRSH